MSFIAKFLSVNRRMSKSLTPDHVHEANVFGAYRKLGTIALSHPDVARVADVGAGREWQFPAYYKRWYGIELIGLDIDAEEMAHNQALDRRVVCDATGVIPLDDASVDLVMVHSGIEHFPDNARFMENMARILRPGGFMLAQFPSRYAPFALANRMLPAWLARRVLRLSMGDTEALGFKAHYDRTNYAAFARLAQAAGFTEIYYLPGYFSSSYFEFFSPAFVLSYLFDMARYTLGMRELASYNLFLLQKPGQAPNTEPFRLYAWK